VPVFPATPSGIPAPAAVPRRGTSCISSVSVPATSSRLPAPAWFIGFRSDGDGPGDDLAFAVLVEGGSSGGAVAAPIAAKLLANLPG
jgi:hypothetical protein